MQKAAVLDLDGVVYQQTSDGHYQLIKGAKEALKLLLQHGIPHVFVTNGTGSTAAQKARKLNEMCGTNYEQAQVITASCPIRNLVPAFKKVIVVASTAAAAVDLANEHQWKAFATIFEFSGNFNVSGNYNAIHEFDAIIIYDEPNDWKLAIQNIVDVCRVKSMPVLVSNPDFEYAASHSFPRLTVGAFVDCVALIYNKSTQKALEIKYFGKPYRPIYEMASKLLKADKVYAIGDNPQSDIKGANEAGPNWCSILVRTGLFKGENDSRNPAKLVCDDLLQAATFIVQDVGNKL